MPSARLFHDLKTPRFSPSSLVSAAGLSAWLSDLTQRRVSVIGSKRASQLADGAQISRPDVSSTAVAAANWGVGTGVNGGFVIGYGTVNGRIPQISGVPIDEEYRTEETPRPELQWRRIGTIILSFSIRFTHVAIPALGAFSGDEPPYASNWSWLSWPEAMWDPEETPVSRSAPPPSGTSNDALIHMPIARVRNGIPARLRWGNIFLGTPYVDTVTEASDNFS